MKSMTGYGRAKQELHGRTITAELRAVNHRYLDCTVKAPRQYGFLDDAVKKAAAARIARGKVEVYIGVETQEGGDIAVTVNHAVAEHYLAALHELADKYGLRDDVSVMSLAKLPDVLGSERIEQDADELTQDVRAPRGLHGEERRFDRVDIRMDALGQTHIARGLGRIGHGRRRAICRAQQAGFAHVAGVDVNGAQTVVDAHACAVRAGERRVFNAPVAQGHGKIAGILDENFGERAAARQRAGKHALADR